MFSSRRSQNEKQKSLQQRFLFVLGIVFFLLYFVLGMMIIFWDELPLSLSHNRRIALGVLLIGYSFLRFIRLIQKNKSNDE
ncbi:hypothetical protein HYN59_01775 [Flavobacterium album]|uniref:C4-dicarboxylate ABC transporter n=1 Tax=Flavobacterium album TaxID=2175091 RepID=A0A2S1QU34_9FLAO|nr:hypothetical protein HYN59_01775 [Flavobacterium album]